MNLNKFSKRTFIKKFSAVMGLVIARQSLAASIVEDMATHQPNKFQDDLIKNPQKQKLMAELAACVGYPPFPNPSKTKCQSSDW